MSHRSAAADQARHWARRPVLAWSVRALAVLIPIAAGVGVSILFASAVGRPSSLAGAIPWWLAATVLAIVTVVAVERLARRLLPLAALLDLTLVFPDRAPRRFAVARRSWRVRDLEGRLRAARDSGAPIAGLETAQAILELVAALSVHDRATRGHSERVRVFTDMLATELRLCDDDAARLRWAALLHDVGKLRVAAGLLAKASKPTASEWASLRRHPLDGAELTAPLHAWLGQWSLAIAQHHERFDGTGYPHGLAGEAISLGGRVVAVADAFETMTAARAYKRAMSPSAAREELVRCSGTHFDPRIVRAFLTISVGRLSRTVGWSGWLAQVPLAHSVMTVAAQTGGQVVATTAMAGSVAVLGTGGAVMASAAAPAPRHAAGVAVAMSAALAESTGPGAGTVIAPGATVTAAGAPVGPIPLPAGASAAAGDETAPAPDTRGVAPDPQPDGERVSTATEDAAAAGDGARDVSADHGGSGPGPSAASPSRPPATPRADPATPTEKPQPTNPPATPEPPRATPAPKPTEAPKATPAPKPTERPRPTAAPEPPDPQPTHH